MQCINKGKSRNPFEFDAKVGIAMTHRANLIVGARAFAGNSFDGHTLHEQLEQAAILMQDTGTAPTTVYTDLGYRGVDHDNPQIEIRHRIHSVLCATGYNIRWLLRMITKHGLRAFLRLLHITHQKSTTHPFAQSPVNRTQQTPLSQQLSIARA